MGFFDKLKKITTNLFSGFTEADEAFFEELEETLVMSDMGMPTAEHIIELLRKKVKEQGITDPNEIYDALQEIIEELLGEGEELNLSTTPSVILVIGGSLGAAGINKLVRDALPQLLEDFQIVHICGKDKIDNLLLNKQY